VFVILDMMHVTQGMMFETLSVRFMTPGVMFETSYEIFDSRCV
jgi:hypothetical protein